MAQTFCVVGGGIAGVCATEELQQHAPQGSNIVLVSISPALKGVGNVVRVTENLEEFEVVEKDLASIAKHPNTRVIVAAVLECDCAHRLLKLSNGECLKYDKLLCATGAAPKVLADHPCVLTLRDTDSVITLRDRLQSARGVVIVGNGGIALELVGALKGVLDVVWVLKHGHVGDAFFDTDAAFFLLKQLEGTGNVQKELPGAASQPDQPQQHSHPQQALDCGQTPALSEHRGAQAVGTKQQQKGAPHAPPASHNHTQPQASPALKTGGPTFGHAAGPKWTQHLQLNQHPRRGSPAGEAATAGNGGSGYKDLSKDSQLQGALSGGGLLLELNALVASIGSDKPDGAGGAVHNSGQQQQQQQQQQQEGSVQAQDTHSGGAGPAGVCGRAPALDTKMAEGEWPAYVQLTNGKVIGADLVISAIGVTPATGWLPPSLCRAPDGGLTVDRRLCCPTGLPTDQAEAKLGEQNGKENAAIPAGSVYAAGDCCSIPEECMGPHFFQMRLWTQARQMGTYAAHCMLGEEDQFGSDLSLELFTHVTRFFGMKVVLLGLYNGQRMEHEPAEDVRIYVRQLDGDGEGEDGSSFVRVVLLRGRMQGCVLIGETGYEEVFEHLILDGLDLSAFGPGLLDPQVELEDYFD